MAELKPCKVCNFTRQKSVGLVVPSLEQLKINGCELLGFSPSTPVSVVLEEDGTIVEDDAYFLCLPLNTKFMLLHEREIWAPVRKIDGGTAWMSRDSVDLETDVVDTSKGGTESWLFLALQLKQDLASVILMSETDLQTLVDIPCSELASVLGFQKKKVENLQETLQRVLDRREEERQSKELLKLYIKAMEKEDGQQAEPNVEVDVGIMDIPDGVEVDAASGFMTRTLMVMKGKTSPETRLSNEELQMVVTKGAETMEQVLGWGSERTSALLQACEIELTRRLQQVQAIQSLSVQTQRDSTQPTEKSSFDSQATPAKLSK
ncbi:DNA fragmentation factor subunit alpha [Aplochiton taeniatus]